MKKIGWGLLLCFVVFNIFIVLSGKGWIYRAVSITYFKGKTSSYIDDFVHFPSVKINSGKHQEWPVSRLYNSKKLPNFINKRNNDLETTAFLVIINDSIKYEKYWHGYSADSMSNSFSMAKSWVSTLIGCAIKEGKIKSVDQKVADFLPEFNTGEKSKITIKHLLTMSSGLDWKESYYNPLGQTAEAYYGNDLKKLVLNLNLISEPGKTFKYQSSCTQILSFVLEKATNKTISTYASEKLWKPMGAKHYGLWNTDRNGGDEKAFCCINSNARDFARLGKLYLNSGFWGDKQILDSSYVKRATTVAKLLNKNGEKNKNYGYHFWIENYKNTPVYYARGLWGQYLICIPDKKMIIVRLGRKQDVVLDNGHHKELYLFIDAALSLIS